VFARVAVAPDGSPRNPRAPTDGALPWKVTVARFELPLKAKAPSVVTEAGMLILVRPVIPSKAPIPTSVRLFGSVSDVIPLAW
jgi:hypothetical protein